MIGACLSIAEEKQDYDWKLVAEIFSDIYELFSSDEYWLGWAAYGESL